MSALDNAKSNRSNIEELDTSWAEVIALPPPGNMMDNGPRGREVFVRQGTRMSSAIENCIAVYGNNKPITDLNILDFGCGVGRVTLPFYHRHQQPKTVCDVDAQAINYIQSVRPEIDAVKIEYDPPTNFPSQHFDIVFAISVWTHLPPGMQISWLDEVFRITRPGGLALISTSSFEALNRRRLRLADWINVSDHDLNREGMIFKPTPAPRGVTGVYGYTLHTGAFVRENWTRRFNLVGIEVGAIEGLQNINVLQRP